MMVRLLPRARSSCIVERLGGRSHYSDRRYTDPMTPQGASEPVAADTLSSVAGVLHVYVAFDWGEEIDLEQAGRLSPCEVLSLSRRSRTPTSIAYKPPPLRFSLAAVALRLPGLDAAVRFATHRSDAAGRPSRRPRKRRTGCKSRATGRCRVVRETAARDPETHVG